jgi:Ca2+-binding EF-hand superfamily protein
MKKLLVVFFSLVLLAGIAEAGPKEARLKHADKNKDGAIDKKEMHMEKDWEHKKKEKVKDIFKGADVNRDGMVSESEINNWKPTKKADSWWKKKADTNNDGVVSEGEVGAWKKLCNEKMDLNKDGKIDQKEKRKCWRHAKSKVNTPVEKKYDTNQDGWLQESEVKEMLKDKHELIKTKGKAKADTEVEKEYDANKDGVIDSNEAESMKEDVNL